jgi:hypothetical protein
MRTLKHFSGQLERIWLSICQGDETFDIKVVLENDSHFAKQFWRQYKMAESVSLYKMYAIDSRI